MKDIVKVNIKSLNINRFIKKLIKEKISIINIDYISNKEIDIIVSYEDYKKIRKYKTTSKIYLKNKYGGILLREKIRLNRYLLIFLGLGLLIIIILSNIIFDVNVIHSNKELRNIIYSNLESYGIKKYRFIKKESKINEIEKVILENNKDIIEWIEIEKEGTTYNIKVQERKLNEEDNTNYYKNIISKKNAIITEIINSKGEKIKNINDYVKKGDIIISKDLIKPDGNIINTKVIGEVYGDVWYTIKCTYPYKYHEEKLTGKSKKVLVLTILGKKIYFPSYKKYNVYNTNKKTIFKDYFSFLSLHIEKQYEVNIIDDTYSKSELITKIINLSKKRLKEKNPDIKKIKKVLILSETNKKDSLELKLFITTNEQIGIYE